MRRSSRVPSSQRLRHRAARRSIWSAVRPKNSLRKREDRRMSKSFIVASAKLTNAVGLHARPSVKLTQLAKSFASNLEVALAPDGPWLDAKSPVKIMRVKASRGTMLHFRARGADAAAAVASVIQLVERRFDEEDEVPVENARG